ncbi:unnamed protein product [Lampetra planeri]
MRAGWLAANFAEENLQGVNIQFVERAVGHQSEQGSTRRESDAAQAWTPTQRFKAVSAKMREGRRTLHDAVPSLIFPRLPHNMRGRNSSSSRSCSAQTRLDPQRHGHSQVDSGRAHTLQGTTFVSFAGRLSLVQKGESFREEGSRCHERRDATHACAPGSGSQPRERGVLTEGGRHQQQQEEEEEKRQRPRCGNGATVPASETRCDPGVSRTVLAGAG